MQKWAEALQSWKDTGYASRPLEELLRTTAECFDAYLAGIAREDFEPLHQFVERITRFRVGLGFTVDAVMRAFLIFRPLATEAVVSHVDGKHMVAAVNLIDEVVAKAACLFASYFVEMERSTARELERLRSEFASMIVHDLQSPAASIVSSAQALRQGWVTEEEHEDYLAHIQEAGERLIELTADLLDLSQIEAGMIHLDKQPGRIAQVIGEVTKAFAVPARQKGITLTQEVPAALPSVTMDRGKIEQVLNNLVHNALKFTPEGGEVTIGAEGGEGGEPVTVWVSDTGRGIPAQDLPIIFEKYRRARKKWPHPQGTGLGLAICKLLVEAHGGSIGVESKEGEGSRFYFTLPTDSGKSEK